MNHRKTEHARTIRTEVLWSARPVDDEGLPIVAFVKRNKGFFVVLVLLLSLKPLSIVMAAVTTMTMKSEPQLVFADLKKPNVIEPIIKVRLDGRLKHLADVDVERREGEVPLLFHIPRTMGGTYHEILKCVGVERTLGSSLDEIKDGKRNRAVRNDQVDAVMTQYFYSAATLFSSDHRGR